MPPALTRMALSGRGRRTRGQALTEFAFLLPVFLIILGATLDLGRVFYAQISLTNAAREGAFQAAATPSSFQAGQPCDTQANLVVCRVLLETKDSFVQIDPADVSLSCDPEGCARAVGNTVTVSVSGDFTLLTPILPLLLGMGQDLVLTGRATAQIDVFDEFPTPSPSPSPTPDPSATPTPYCVNPPNVLGSAPAAADAAISNAGLSPLGYGDLTTGVKGIVREQNPDATQCVEPGATVEYHYRPS